MQASLGFWPLPAVLALSDGSGDWKSSSTNVAAVTICGSPEGLVVSQICGEPCFHEAAQLAQVTSLLVAEVYEQSQGNLARRRVAPLR